MAEAYHLIVAIPDKEPTSYTITEETVSLGRAPDNDIQVLVREVSTSHCQFKKTESGYEVSDRGSTNGTKVNGSSVKNGQIALNDRDVILLGETVPSYFVVAEAGAAIDVKAIVSEIEGAKAAAVEAIKAGQPTVKKLAAPSPVKKAALPAVKPPASIPSVTPVEGDDVGAATVKLAKTPSTKLGSPPVRKLPTPGAPPAAKLPTPGAPPAAVPIKPSTPSAPPANPAGPAPISPPKKLVPPGAAPAEAPKPGLAAPPAAPKPAAPPATPAAPPASPSAPSPATPNVGEAQPPKKIALPGNPGAKPPSLQTPGSGGAAPPVKKLALPPKKDAGPKLNIPDKEE